MATNYQAKNHFGKKFSNLARELQNKTKQYSFNLCTIYNVYIFYRFWDEAIIYLQTKYLFGYFNNLWITKYIYTTSHLYCRWYPKITLALEPCEDKALADHSCGQCWKQVAYPELTPHWPGSRYNRWDLKWPASDHWSSAITEWLDTAHKQK